MRKTFLMSGLLLSVFGLTTACSDSGPREVGELKTLESGLEYEFIKLGEETAPDTAKWLVLNMQALAPGDSMLFNTAEQGMPMGIPLNAPELKGLMSEGLRLLHKGDSVRFMIPAKDFYTQTANVPVPPGIDENSKLVFNIGVADVTDEEGYRQMQMAFFQKKQAEMATQQQDQLVDDIAIIDKYLADNKIVADTTASGVRIQVTEAGTGAKPEAGDNIVVHYRGKLLSGEQFDASYDRGEPLTFPIGQGQVIRGWDESLLQLPKGSKATIYIPSPLAYGPQQRSEVIKANSILVFDVEVLDVQKQKQ